MKKSITISALCLVISTFICTGQTQESKLTLLFTGDIMGHDGQIASAYNDSSKTYSYDNVFKYIAPVISSADLAIGNLEVTLAGPPYTGYPAFTHLMISPLPAKGQDLMCW